MVKQIASSSWLTRLGCFSAVVCSVLSEPSIAEQRIAINEDSHFRFATIEEARKIVSADDAFTRQLTKLDVQSRLHSVELTRPSDYQSSIAADCTQWQAKHRDAVSSAAIKLAELLRPYDLPLPNEIQLVASTGATEAKAPHTRGTAIIFPESRIGSERGLVRLIAHELFHILSRQNPAWRDALYRAIGYNRCNEIELPPRFADRRITNPDAPIVQHYINVEIDGEERKVTQILLSKLSEYQAGNQAPFFAYLDTKFVELTEDSEKVVARLDGTGAPVFHEVVNLPSFKKQIGNNTRYLIHPEEILADNFSFLITGHDVTNPEVLQRIKDLIAGSPEE